MSRLDALLHRVVLHYSSVPRTRPARARPELAFPGDRQAVRLGRRALAYLMALALPVSVAALLIPLRTDHAAAVALVMVVPVVLIAAIGATGPAVVAAASASLAFDLFLTEPYYRFVISDPDDVVAAIALCAVGLVVGVLSSRLGHLVASNATRRNELSHLITFIGEAETAASTDDLSALVCGHLVDLLGLRRCEWLPHAQEANGPVLLPSGAVRARTTELDPDRGKLPERVHVPNIVGGRQLGCFVMTSDGHRLTSIEERRTAATIADIFSRSFRALSG